MAALRIGLLAFPAMTQLDLTGPLQVFASLRDADVRVLWKTLDPIQTQAGLRLLPDTTLDACPHLDVICVPGGPGVVDLMDDEVVLSFLRTRAETARFIGSICTGALVLGAAGLLRGKKGDNPLGLDRPAGAARGHPDTGPGRAGRQDLQRRRRHRRDRLRAHDGGGTGRPGCGGKYPAWHRVRPRSAIRCWSSGHSAAGVGGCGSIPHGRRPDRTGGKGEGSGGEAGLIAITR
jgi:hypothetical protein